MKGSRTHLQVPVKERVTTIGVGGRRFWLYPASFSGIWLKRRQILAAVLILFFFILPWVKLGGQQAVLLDVAERKFAIFGLVFWPQDSLIFWFFLVGTVVAIFLITAIWGRIWCGWACPQTVFLEHVFRRIETWIEGDGSKRRRRDKGPMTWDKFWRKTLKMLIFVVVSSHFANTVLCYFVGTDDVLAMTLAPPGSNWSWFTFMFLVNALFIANFAWFREQFCLIACPYGRFQSVLLDSDSLIVGYKERRGEPRAVWRKKEERTAGDCIDCNRCVAVCPTGIDIRMGLQMECINCTACMDACDEIMERTGQPKGLIGYSSQAEIEGRPRKVLRTRVMLYSLLLLVLWSAGAVMLANRSDVILRFTRPPGTSFTLVGDQNLITNHFQLKGSNKSDHEVILDAQVPEGYELVAPFNPWKIPPQTTMENQVFIRRAKDRFDASGKEKVQVTFNQEDGTTHKVEVTLMGPKQ